MVADCDLARRPAREALVRRRGPLQPRGRAAAHKPTPAELPDASLAMAPVRYPVETFTDAERALLEPYFTNLDRPVFALVNLPETVKGAMFARYSRYPGTLRRMFLDEFADDVPRRARGPSTASRASAPRASTSASSSATATTRSPRSAARTWPASGSPTCSPRSSSAAASPPTWSSRPATSPTTSRSSPAAAIATTPTTSSARAYREAMDELFCDLLAQPGDDAGLGRRALAARREQPERAWASSIRAKALDLLRGLLPAVDAEPRRHLRLRPGLRGPAAAAGGLAAARGARLRRDAPRRARAGDRRASSPASGAPTAAATGSRTCASAARRPSARSPGSASTAAWATATPSVELVHVDGTEDDLLAATLYESAGAPEAEIRSRISALDPIERAELIGELAGERRNRRHRPGRGWEAVRYRFEIVSDYGGFRDLQRHRMLTCQWQRLGPELGAGVPEEVREAGRRRRVRAGAGDLEDRVRAARGRRTRRGGAVRALPRLPDPLRARPQRARGDAPAASCAPAARATPPTAPSPRRCTSGSPRCTRRSRRRCATSTPPPSPARADPERDPHPPQAGRRRAGRPAARRQHLG